MLQLDIDIAIVFSVLLLGGYRWTTIYLFIAAQLLVFQCQYDLK